MCPLLNIKYSYLRKFIPIFKVISQRVFPNTAISYELSQWFGHYLNSIPPFMQCASRHPQHMRHHAHLADPIQFHPIFSKQSPLLLSFLPPSIHKHFHCAHTNKTSDDEPLGAFALHNQQMGVLLSVGWLVCCWCSLYFSSFLPSSFLPSVFPSPLPFKSFSVLGI
jgi:hypothetical protein